MPLAHPQSIIVTSNYEEPCVAVAFATSRPGEPLADFRHRLSVRDHYSRTKGVELVLDREAATELVRMLVPDGDWADDRLLVGTHKCRYVRRGSEGAI